MAYIKLKEYGKAARDALFCIKIKRDFAKGYYRLGLATAALGHYVKAAEAFSVGMSLEPKSVEMKMGFEKVCFSSFFSFPIK